MLFSFVFLNTGLHLKLCASTSYNLFSLPSYLLLETRLGSLICFVFQGFSYACEWMNKGLKGVVKGQEVLGTNIYLWSLSLCQAWSRANLYYLIWFYKTNKNFMFFILLKEKLNQRNYLVIQPSDIEPGFKLNSHSKTCVDFKTTCHNSKKVRAIITLITTTDCLHSLMLPVPYTMMAIFEVLFNLIIVKNLVSQTLLLFQTNNYWKVKYRSANQQLTSDDLKARSKCKVFVLHLLVGKLQWRCESLPGYLESEWEVFGGNWATRIPNAFFQVVLVCLIASNHDFGGMIFTNLCKLRKHSVTLKRIFCSLTYCVLNHLTYNICKV